MALRTAAEIQKKGFRRPGQPHTNPIMVYQCDCCGGIHIGHITRKESILLYENDEPIDIRQLQGLK